jgi:hypothetical protein
MKQSLIITLIICFVLGESINVIAKRSSEQNKSKTYCCNKECNPTKAGKKNPQTEPYLPMVNMLRYNL